MLKLVTCLIFLAQSHSFITSSTKTRSSSLLMAGRGMGMAAPPKKAKKTAQASFDAIASLGRLEKKYDDILLAQAKVLSKEHESPDDPVTSEYIVTARAPGSALRDWIPIAQLCVVRTQDDAHRSDGSADPIVKAAVSHYCRELSVVASKGSRAFQTVPRNNLEYAVESMDSFHKYVYQVVVEGKNDHSEGMTKTMAREILEIDETIDSAGLKKVYRKLSFDYHPDRFVGSTDDERDSAAQKYHEIKLAYETLSSGVREENKSWYESLGGRSRTDFVGPIKLLSLSDAKTALERVSHESAIVGLDPDIVHAFVARCQSQ